ncbi:hypothetical protein [Actinomycetospora callitridis]|uniref:hypothetical protein n=1 Tax=Actinomycetospora callitridis TaxID=913944 RepID=UPI002365A5AE|nr:hypothetical protein [Actinomycetospora callitridis]MDD7916326.1 hypothetical protein [Actinomycetospora callitridis]
MITNRDLDVIGLRDLAAAAPPTADPRVVVPPVAATEYELVSEPLAYAEGWSLVCRRGGRVAWSIPLAPRGAAPRVRPAVAQAVAVRVLSEQGVFVSGWNHMDDGDDTDGYRRFAARLPHGASVLA